MLGQYLAKLYVDKVMGKETPDYFERLKLTGDGLLEKAFNSLGLEFRVLGLRFWVWSFGFGV